MTTRFPSLSRHNSHQRSPLRAMLSRVTALAVCISFMHTAQLHAQSVPPTPTLPGSSLKAIAGTAGLPSFEEMQAALSRYQGATAAFSQTYATLSAQPLDSWLQSNGAALSSTLGVPSITGSLQTPLDLQAFLANSGFAAQLKSWASLLRT